MLVSIPIIQYFSLALTRILAILSTVPILGGQVIPTQVRVGFGFFLAMIITPMQPALIADVEIIAIFPYALAVGKELIIGIVAGYAATLTFASLQLAGELIGFTTGFNSGRVLNPAFGSSSSTVDQFMTMLSLLFFMVINGHHLFIFAIQRTFTLAPINAPLPGFTADAMISLTAGLITAGIQLALPAMGALMLVDITLGLFARVAPRVQVFFLGIPFKVALGLLALATTLSLFYPKILSLLEDIGPQMLNLMGA